MLESFLALPCLSSNSREGKSSTNQKRKNDINTSRSTSFLPRSEHISSTKNKKHCTNLFHHLTMMHAISISQKTWSRIIFWIQKISRRNKMLMKKHSACYKNTHSGLAINITDIIWCYTKAGHDPTNWKIVLPNELIKPMVK